MNVGNSGSPVTELAMRFNQARVAGGRGSRIPESLGRRLARSHHHFLLRAVRVDTDYSLSSSSSGDFEMACLGLCPWRGRNLRVVLLASRECSVHTAY